MNEIKVAYLRAAASAVELLRDPAIAANWSAPSALTGFTVGGLAGHLASQLFAVRDLLAEPSADDEPIGLLDHYAQAPWVNAGLDEEINVNIRASGATLAEPGAAVLVERADATLAELRDVIVAQPVERVVRLKYPWSLTIDDLLITRLMEITVHADDLAFSVGIPTPPVPPAVLEPVIDLLTRLAVRRHGATAVLRALSRSERAPATIAAL